MNHDFLYAKKHSWVLGGFEFLQADNVTANAGSGGATFASDDVGGVQYPRAKVTWGADGVANDANAATPLPVVQTGTPGLPSGASTAAKQPALGTAGTASTDVISIQGIASMTAVKVDGSAVTQPVSLASVPSHAVTNAGTFAVQVTSGAGTSIVDKAAFTEGSTALAPVGGVYNETIAADPTEDQAAAFRITAKRALHVNLRDSSGNELASGAQYAEDSVHASGDLLTAIGVVRKDTATQLAGTDGDYSVLVNDASGRLHTNVGAVPADPFGVNADAASATGSISAKLRFIAGTGIPVTGTVTVGSHAVTNAGTFAVQAGQAAHAASISGNPVRVGARAATADYTAVTDGQTADLLATTLGKQVVVPYSIPANTWNYAAAAAGLVSTGGVTAKAAAGSGIRIYVTSVQVVNSHATVSTEILINDGAAGTTLHRGWAQAVGGGYACKFDPPLRGTANTLLEIKEGTATATTGVYVNLQGYVAAE